MNCLLDNSSGHVSELLGVTHVVLSLDVGGLERNVINQVREGRKLGQDVSVVCLERPGELASQVDDLGGRVVCLHKPPGLKLSFIGRMKRALADLKPSIVHTHQVGTLFYAGPAARRARVPVVVHTEHGRENYAGSLRRRLLGRWAARYAHRFYCLTDDMAAWVRRHRVATEEKLRVIQNGIDTAVFVKRCDTTEVRRSLGIPPLAPLIGTVGRLNEIKQQHVLIRSFALLRERMPATHLLIVGDGPLRRELSNIVEELGLSHFVHFAGYQASASAYLQSMDAFALTSRSEGMPQAVLEAGICEVPVVCTRVGGLPELIEPGQTGLLCEVGDVGAFADAFFVLLSDRALAGRLAAAARSRVEERFDVSRMARDYHRDFLDLLLGQSQVGGSMYPRSWITPGNVRVAAAGEDTAA